MTIKNILLLFFSALILTSLSLNAQETTNPVKKSTKKETLNGKKYFVHEVQKGETLFAISKAYNIDKNIIAIENPEVFESLKPGQILHIPCEVETIPTKATSFKTHTVSKGETLYSISKKYSVSIADLNKYNPEVSNGLQIGQAIKIPIKSEVLSDNSIPKDTAKYIYHKIEKNQTLYSISRQYNVSIDDIYQANQELETKGLKNGEYIRIPKSIVNKPVINEEISVETKTDTLKEAIIQEVNYVAPVNNTDCGKFNYITNHPTFKVSLILPLQSDALTIASEDEASANSNFEPQPKPFLEYYEGFLLAVDSMKRKGVNITVKLFDLKKDSAKTQDIINKGELDNSDIIIGPVYDQNFKMISDHARKKNINVIYPINSHNPEIFTNPKVFQVNSSLSSQMSQATRYLASFKDINYIVIQNGTKEELEIVNNYKTKLFKEFANNFNTDKVPYSEILYSAEGLSGVEKTLKNEVINVLIIPSGNQIFVINLLTKLQPLTKKYKIIMAGMPSWKKFDNNLELEYLHNLNMHTFVPFYADYSNTAVKSFVIDYRYNYKCEPSKYSMLGFDTGIYFLTALQNYGHDFQDCLHNLDLQLLQSDFNFVKLGENGGYENNGTFILHYNMDNDVKIVNVITDSIKNPIILPDIQIRKIKQQ
ncbi:MAG: LysM peptidoglycan-binding domain-containing protein [Bacteroidia bacterium]|nr:LysM peptidoglycan-binding domain-containing protein [Bacteroidia bacterium]